MDSNEYDFQEELISEKISSVNIPSVFSNSRLIFSASKEPSGKASQPDVLSDFRVFMELETQQERDKKVLLQHRQKYIGEQLEKQKVYKQKKMQELEKKHRQKIETQCTFKPKILQSKQKRSFQQFLESQYKHAQKVLAKRESIKKIIQEKSEKATFQPKVNSHRKSQVNVFERLCNQKEKEKENHNQTQGQKKFQPAITEKSKKMQRSAPIDQLLYSDALRRQNKNKQMELMMSSISQSKMPKTVNYKMEKLAAQKFIRQYFIVFEKLQLQSTSIDYMNFIEILRCLGFAISEEDSTSKNAIQQRSLVHNAYEFLTKYEVNSRNICIFLLAIIGIYHINPVNFDQYEQQTPTNRFLNMDEQEGRKLQKNYNLLYRNRLSSQESRRIENSTQKYTFVPTINKNSQSLAEKHRQQMLEQANQLLEKYPQIDFNIPEDGVISHTQLLVLHRLAKNVQNARKKEQFENKNLQQCTFKPTTLSNVHSLNNSKVDSQHGIKKCIQLYNQHREIQYRKDSLQASRQVYQDQQCTFAPKINQASMYKSVPAPPVAKQTQQAIYRMKKGRMEHEQKKKFLQRGQLLKSQDENSKKIVKQSNSNSQQSQRVPTLIIDVNMGQKIEQIYIYKGDQNRINQIAHTFACEHDLSTDSELKLIQLLKDEIKNVLQKIEEDQQSNEYQ